MAPFLPFVHTPEQLEGVKAQPGEIGKAIQPLERDFGPLGPIVAAPVAAPLASAGSPLLLGLKKFLPGGGGNGSAPTQQVMRNGLPRNGFGPGPTSGQTHATKETAATAAATSLNSLLGGQAQRIVAALLPKLPPGKPIPTQMLNTVQGGKIQIGAPTGRWQLIVVYRGKHDPVSRNYLVALGQVLGDLQELGVELLAVSGDPRERAESFVELLKAASQTKEVPFKIAYGMTLMGMRQWGLYISEPRNDRETDRPFPEPAMFLLNEDGLLHVADYSNSPFSRPDIRILIEGIRYIQENDYPVRGDFDVKDGIDWPRIMGATYASTTTASQL